MRNVAVALLFAAATASAVGGGYRERLKQLRAEAQAQQDKLNLPRAKLYAQYPTPEAHLAQPLKLACGQAKPFEVKGRFPTGTQLVAHSDDVVLEGVKVSATAASGTVRALPTLLPGSISLEAIAPVTLANQFVLLARVEEALDVTLRFADGWTAHVAPDGSTSWKKGTATRTSRAGISGHEDGLHVDFEPPPEVMKIQEERVETLTAAPAADMDAATNKMNGQVEACMRMTSTDKQGACMAKAYEDYQKAFAPEVKRLEDANTRSEAKMPADAWACKGVVISGGAATATCKSSLEVTAQVKCLGPI